MDSLVAVLALGPVGRSMEGMKLELLFWAAFWERCDGRPEVLGCGISAGAIIEEEDGGKEMEERSSISGSESESSSTRACDITGMCIVRCN